MVNLPIKKSAPYLKDRYICGTTFIDYKKSTHNENANTFSTVNAGLRPQILRIIFNAFPLALNGPFAHQRLHRFSAPPALCTALIQTLSPSQKFDIIVPYFF